MSIKRILRHATFMEWQVRRAFPQPALRAIEEAIAASEASHAGQICLAIEGALSGPALLRKQSARERAREVFAHLGVWDTEHNNGVLIYLLMADHDVEILADRGIHARVGPAGWERICHDMKNDFRQRRFTAGVLGGIQAVSRHLIEHFPAGDARRNELPDAPRIL